ncbi:unnamed protein product, partial [Prunus brigantina]
AQGTFSRVLGGQGNLAHNPVPNLEGTGFDPGIIVLSDALFVRDVAHVGLVTELLNEVEDQSTSGSSSGQQPLALSSLVFRVLLIILFTASTWPLD